ncbi:hypothetical protein [Streptomyces odonnellii]|uniref:hypothetical protein n=1 Tax=Streptomyces odonnellii TaxID=1417980 RepID=UPI0012FF25FA|nr:hypothetical protein [Streptomyces odonnellii]
MFHITKPIFHVLQPAVALRPDRCRGIGRVDRQRAARGILNDLVGYLKDDAFVDKTAEVAGIVSKASQDYVAVR